MNYLDPLDFITGLMGSSLMMVSSLWFWRSEQRDVIKLVVIMVCYVVAIGLIGVAGSCG